MFRTNFQCLKLALGFQFGFEIRAAVEVVRDGPLRPTGHENQDFAPRFNGLIHGVVNHRAINDRQHFFGNAFGRWQKPGAQTRNREYGFTQGLQVKSPPGDRVRV